jgi:hypothetical protein
MIMISVATWEVVKEYAYTTGTLGSLITSVPYTYVSAWKDQLTKHW